MNQAFSLAEVLWSTDPAAQQAIGVVLGLAAIVAITVFIPLTLRLFRLSSLERRLRALQDEPDRAGATATREEYEQILAGSPIEESYAEFKRRWKTAQLAQTANGSETADRAPIRMLDVFEERPLLPFGPRRSLLPVLPGLFLAIGVFSALSGLIPSLSESNSQGMTEAARAAWIAGQLGLALRAAAWGFLCAIGAAISGRLIEGAFDARSHGLDESIEQAFGSVSPGELAELTRRHQEQSLLSLGRDLGNFNKELNDRIDRGLQRIEQSTSRAASLVSQEQRGALNTVVQELSLSIRQGVDQHLSELRAALSRAVEHQTSVTGALAETFEQMVEHSKNQDLVARTLTESAGSVEEASRSLRGAAIEMNPVLENLNRAHGALEKTAVSMNETQGIVARTVDGVRTSLDAAAGGANDQRQFIERTMSELQRAMGGLESGLGDSVSRSLREIDETLAKTVGLLRETLSESNETIERLASPIRAAEGSTRETHLALDRVRGEVEALGQWMSQVAKPLRGGLTDVEGRAEEISRSLAEFNGQVRQIDKTMEALRHEIREESRRLQGAGTELARRLSSVGAGATLGVPLGAIGGGVADDAFSGTRGHPEPSQRTRPARAEVSAERPSDDQEVDLTYRAAYPTQPARSAEPTLSGSPAADASDPLDDSGPGISGTDTQSPELDPMMRSLPKIDTSLSDGSDMAFRMGTPRAQGPDPYVRFDSPGTLSEGPVEVMPPATPVVEKGFGKDLKLSELLRGRKNHASKPISAQKSGRSPSEAPENAAKERQE